MSAGRRSGLINENKPIVILWTATQRDEKSFFLVLQTIENTSEIVSERKDLFDQTGIKKKTVTMNTDNFIK